MSELASERFDLTVESEGTVGWLKAPIFALVAYVSQGAVELYPPTIIRVIDRDTGEEKMTQVWRTPSAVDAAVKRLRADLDQLTVLEFLESWALDTDRT